MWRNWKRLTNPSPTEGGLVKDEDVIVGGEGGGKRKGGASELEEK